MNRLSKKNRFLTSILCMILLLSLTGCGSTMVNLTEEETDVISEYAVNILLKYDKNSDSKLIDEVEEVIEEEITDSEDVSDENLEEYVEDQTEEEIHDSDEAISNTVVEDVSQDIVVEPVASTLEDYYGIEGFSFNVQGYEVLSSYPESSASDMYFTMDATAGNQLLVVKIVANNISGTDQFLNMGSYNLKLRMSVNGDKAQNILATMLANDIRNYRGDVAAGDSVELVSIIEIPMGTAINDVELVLRGNDENLVITI